MRAASSEDLRECSKCAQSKQIQEFKRNKNRPCGFDRICKRCHADTEKQRCAANPEKRRANAREQYRRDKDAILARQRARYASDPDARRRVAAASKAWHEAHPGVLKQASLRWKKANPEKTRAQCRRYKKRRPDVVNAGIQLRRARKIDAAIQCVTAKMLHDRASVFGHVCAYCGGPHEQWDHVIPLSRGGKHCLANLRPACARCNRSKHAKRLCEWKREAA